jgi:hypothetical protein
VRPPRGSVRAVIVVFILVGGYAGGLAVAAEMALSGLGGLADSSLSGVVAIPFLAVLGCVFGFGPAAGTGLIAGLLAPIIPPKGVWVTVMTLVGAGLSGLLLGHDSEGWRWYGAIGGLSAFVSAVIALQVRPRWSN